LADVADLDRKSTAGQSDSSVVNAGSGGQSDSSVLVNAGSGNKRKLSKSSFEWKVGAEVQHKGRYVNVFECLFMSSYILCSLHALYSFIM